jgi:hypothetical protein
MGDLRIGMMGEHVHSLRNVEFDFKSLPHAGARYLPTEEGTKDVTAEVDFIRRLQSSHSINGVVSCYQGHGDRVTRLCQGSGHQQG